MRRFDWSRPAFLIGFVLANPVENYANNATQIAGIRFRSSLEEGLSYVASPIVIVLAIITILSIIVGLKQAKNILAEGHVASGAKRAPIVFLLVLTGFSFYALIDAWLIPSYAFVDAVFPLTVASVTSLCGVILLVQMRLKPETSHLFADREHDKSETYHHGLWGTLKWFAGLLLLTSLIGFIMALAAFLVAFFKIRAKESWLRTICLSSAGILFMCFMAKILNRDFPAGLLQSYMTLPWPLG